MKNVPSALARFVKIILGILLIFLLTRVAFFDFYSIPSDSMMETIKTGDMIIVNKTLYSGVLSRVLSSIGFDAQPAANDIIVFRLEAAGYDYWVKRCIGKPGEVVEIRKGKVFINSKEIIDPPTSRHFYSLWYNSFAKLQGSLKRTKVDESSPTFKRFPKYISTYLTKSQRDNLIADSAVDSIKIDDVGFSKHEMLGSPLDSMSNITIENLSPTIIPYNGWQLRLESVKLLQYYTTLASFEKADIQRHSDGKFYLEGKQIESYTFKNNYFFVLGDNRDDSYDSRNFGFIPSTIIIGRVVKIIH